MTLLEILTLIANKSGQTLTQDIGNNETVKSLLTKMFNLRHQDFNNRFPWPWREKTTVIQSISNYKDGTVTVANGSRTVTGNGTVWTSAMEGRFFKLNREGEFYEILDVVSGTELTLKEPYLDNSGSSLEYLIWHRYYDLPPDIPLNSNLLVWNYPYKSHPIPRNEIENSFRQAHLQGFPTAWAFGRKNRINSTYNTGTVSITENSRVLTGNGTSWLGNVQEGSKITIGSTNYNVESIDSDTQITMVQRALQTLSGQSYTIETGNRQTIVLSSVPDPRINLNIIYSKKTYNLLHDNDESEIWNGFIHIPIIATYSEYLDKLTSERAFSWLTVYEGMVREAWRVITDSETPEQATRFITRLLDNYRAGLYS